MNYKPYLFGAIIYTLLKELEPQDQDRQRVTQAIDKIARAHKRLAADNPFDIQLVGKLASKAYSIAEVQQREKQPTIGIGIITATMYFDHKDILDPIYYDMSRQFDYIASHIHDTEEGADIELPSFHVADLLSKAINKVVYDNKRKIS